MSENVTPPFVKAVPPTAPASEGSDSALTQETLQDFVAAFNAGVAGMITPIKKRVKTLEDSLAELTTKTEKKQEALKTELVTKQENAVKEQKEEQKKAAEITKQEIAETKVNLEKVLISIPELNKEIQQIFQIVTNLLKIYQTLFGKTSVETEAILKQLEPKILALPQTSKEIVVNSVKSVETVKPEAKTDTKSEVKKV